ncbi:hypothetical protein IFR05_016947 [Cadophora sp. M221]|nr:hypothetical protein IFR05_016947 [Cadophora sp. M221]
MKDNGNCNVAGRGRPTSPSKEGSLLGMGTLVGEMDGLCFAELMHALQKIARLQREATSAQIDVRQKRREAAFKRQEVWIWDAKFMGEVQRLSAEGKLAGLGELLELTTKCQNARDDLGPLEQEGTEAEQHWEGQIYTLRQTEERFYNEFNREFAIVEAYSPGPSSDDSSQYRSSSRQKSEGSDDIATPSGRMIIPYRIGSAGSITSSSSLPLRPLPEDLPDRDSELNRQGPFLAGLEGIGAEIETWNLLIALCYVFFPVIGNNLYNPCQTSIHGAKTFGCNMYLLKSKELFYGVGKSPYIELLPWASS